MALLHYYIEDKDVDPMREDRTKPVRSIQFTELTSPDMKGYVHVNLQVPILGTRRTKDLGIRIPIEELKHAYDWMSQKH